MVAQRDLYSAFLAQCVEDGRLDADLAGEAWSNGADSLLQAALSQIEQPANGRPALRRVPASFGLSGRRQSRSPVEPIVNASKAQDVVPSSTLMVGELEKARWTVRTP